MKTLEAYLDNNKKLKSTRLRKDLLANEEKEKKEQIEEKFKKQIRELEEKMKQEVKECTDSYQSEKEEAEESIKTGNELLKEFHKILKLMDVRQCTPEDIESLHSYRMKTTFYPLELFYSDDALMAYAFVVKTEKPKNRYALMLAGDTILNGFIYLDRNSVSGVDRGIDKRGCLKVNILVKEFDEEEKAKVYYEKNKDKILKDKLAEYFELKKEFDWVCKNTMTPMWELQRLIFKEEEFRRGYGYRYETYEEYQIIINSINRMKMELGVA